MPRAIVLLLFSVASSTSAHPQPGLSRLGGLSPAAGEQEDPLVCDPARPSLAPVLSYHAHIQFMPNNNASVSTAKAVHAAFVKRFFPSAVAYCTADFHQRELCIWQSDPCLGPIGPFATAQWAAFIPLARVGEVSGWLLQQRQGLSVLIHPNTGCNELDHSTWPMWMGEPCVPSSNTSITPSKSHCLPISSRLCLSFPP